MEFGGRFGVWSMNANLDTDTFGQEVIRSITRLGVNIIASCASQLVCMELPSEGSR